MASGDIVVATLMLDFRKDGDDGGAGKDGHLSLEQLEGKEYVMWMGGVDLLDHRVLGGTKDAGSKYSKEIEEYVVFANSETGTLPSPAKGSVSLTPVGRALTISDAGVISEASVGTPSLGDDKVTLILAEKVVAVFKATYTAEGDKFKVTTSLPVVVVIAIGKVK